MTGNLNMNSYIHQVQQMPVIKKYVDAITNNILSGSETFQGDINIMYRLPLGRACIRHFRLVMYQKSNVSAVNK